MCVTLTSLSASPLQATQRSILLSSIRGEVEAGQIPGTVSESCDSGGLDNWSVGFHISVPAAMSGDHSTWNELQQLHF